MSNKFGSRVIGREAAETAQVIEKKRANHFGPRVIGDVLNRHEEIKEAEEKDSLSSPAARQAKKEAAAREAEERAKKRADDEAKHEKEVEAPITSNLEELEEALKNNPAFYEKLYHSEQARAEGPRKGALRLFLAHEMDHEDRDERKEEIQALLSEA